MVFEASWLLHDYTDIHCPGNFASWRTKTEMGFGHHTFYIRGDNTFIYGYIERAITSGDSIPFL